ncbi:hypothetical protein GCM10009650_23550 [Nesterenkonia jeotgali]
MKSVQKADHISGVQNSGLRTQTWKNGRNDTKRHVETRRITMRRFLTLPDVAEALNISMSQTRALIKTGDLEGIQIGGRGQWRVEEAKLDEYIERQYAAQRESRSAIASTPAPGTPQEHTPRTTAS